MIAPTLTGILIEIWGWRSAFFISAVISFFIIILAIFSVENVSPVAKNHPDYFSLLLSTSGLSSILVGLSNITTRLFISLILLLIGIVLIIIFCKR